MSAIFAYTPNSNGILTQSTKFKLDSLGLSGTMPSQLSGHSRSQTEKALINKMIKDINEHAVENLYDSKSYDGSEYHPYDRDVSRSAQTDKPSTDKSKDKSKTR